VRRTGRVAVEVGRCMNPRFCEAADVAGIRTRTALVPDGEGCFGFADDDVSGVF